MCVIDFHCNSIVTELTHHRDHLHYHNLHLLVCCHCSIQCGSSVPEFAPREHIWCSFMQLLHVTHQSINLVWGSAWSLHELAKAPAASLPGPMIIVGLSRPVAGLRPMLSSCHVAWAEWHINELPNMPAFRNLKYWNTLQWPYLDWKSSKSGCNAPILVWRRTGKRTETPEDAGLCSDSEVSSNICMICLSHVLGLCGCWL